MSIFFKRILQIADNKGFKNITDFSKNGLKWLSSEKLNRLRKENNKPSIDILVEISNKFDDINLHWLITGKGNLLLNEENSSDLVSDTIETELLENQNTLLKENLHLTNELVEMQKEKIKSLEEKVKNCESEKKILANDKSIR